MAFKNIIISLIIIIGVGFAAWTTLLTFRPEGVATASVTNLPDGYMEEVNALILDKQGKPSMKIVTPKMLHYAADDTTQLASPQLTLYRKSPQPWYVTSKYAKATQGIENVNFWDDVVIHHSADQDNPATVIKTATLTVHPNKQIADTNDFITMVQPNIIVKAIGMHADLNTGDIKLLSQARGEYEPNS